LELINVASKEKNKIGDNRIVTRSNFSYRKYMVKLLDKIGLKKPILNFIKQKKI